MEDKVIVWMIDGHQISASAARDGDSAALHRVKQILLSSFASQTKGLAITPPACNNESEGSPHEP